MNNTDLKEYYREIEKLLVCQRKQKADFMSALKADIDEYIATVGQADIENIRAEFGTPEKIAESFLSNSDAVTIKRKTDLRKCIVAAVIVALVIYFAFVIISLVDVHTEAHGYIEEGIMMINTLTGGGSL